jgi:LmbE family N-acetylglucosaminyl deacetylase
MCVLAHPDDESLGAGGILAKYAAEGVETYLVTATRGERGWMGDAKDNPGLEALGKIREAELRAAAKVLGLREVHLLDYVDGDLDQADPAAAIAKIAAHLRRARPQVVVTFGPDGNYGHPDHIAISHFTVGAVVCAADASYVSPNPPHRVSKLYFLADTHDIRQAARPLFGDLTMEVDGVVRPWITWDPWALAAQIDAEAHWRTAVEAALCHRSQIPEAGLLANAPEETLKRIWGRPGLMRVYSLVNGGRKVERDLFEGLR